MICVSPRRYLVMTGRLQVKQQKGRPFRDGPEFLRTARENPPISRPAWAADDLEPPPMYTGWSTGTDQV
jgi:hypothetical protein